MVAHNTGSTVTCSVIKLAYYNLKLYELEIYDLIVAKVALKLYRYRHRGKSLFTYRVENPFTLHLWSGASENDPK